MNLLNKIKQAFRFSKSPELDPIKLEDPFRYKILLYCTKVFSNEKSANNPNNYIIKMWNEIHEYLQFRHGRGHLCTNQVFKSCEEDAANFLRQCEDSEFLAFIEQLFKLKCLFHIGMHKNAIVEGINEFFETDKIDYQLTQFVTEEVIEPVHSYPYFGRERKIKFDRERPVRKVVAYPKVIRKDIFSTDKIRSPMLEMISNPKFKSVNAEYQEAISHFEVGEFGDCLIKCASSLESTMKIILSEKGWDYNESDTARKLLKQIIDKSSLETFFESPIIIIATLRNKLSGAHGAGPCVKTVSKHKAQYALNTTASTILLLVGEILNTK